MKFSKIFLAALLAVVAGSILSGLFWLVTLFSLAGSSAGAVSVMPHSVLKIDMADNIVDSPSANPFADIDFTTLQTTRSLTVLEVIRAIDAAKADSRIDGILLNFTGAGTISAAAIEELRGALLSFRAESGKWVVAYNDTYSQLSYYLASAADEIYIHPEGGMEWKGLSSTLLFYKGAMEKLGLNVEVFRPTACRYKSAVEPYIRKKMSEANRVQMQALCDDMWGSITEAVSLARGISVGRLNQIADRLEIALPSDAVRCGLVDGTLSNDEMEQKLVETGAVKNVLGEFSFVSLGDYCSMLLPDTHNLSSQIGIIYADGQIFDGDAEGVDGAVYGTALARTIADARRDDAVKAVVLRVNSPGGSALASDVIWREVELLKAEKPVIVSMGGYAASGGYYISCPADAILADRLTVTGSIGVFGLFLEGGEMLEDKLGLTFDGVRTNPSADFGSGVMGMMLRPSTAVERKMIMQGVDRVYSSFTGKVAAGRNLPLERVLEISEGRVWSGSRATEIGLADANGGLKEAIALAADRAGISDSFSITELLGEQTPMAALMRSLNMQLRTLTLSDTERTVLAEYDALRTAVSLRGVQALCPMRITFD